ncbi:hypothetical protein HG530_010102 [Fusarium avenaceum]|nr:hypothetical protein HG530_010102 [Fusarium avenaceum]
MAQRVFVKCALFRPSRWRFLGLTGKTLFSSLFSELLDPSYGADRRLDRSPELNEHIDCLAQGDQLHKRYSCQPDIYLPSKTNSETNKKQSQSRRGQIEDQYKPALYYHEQVKRPL